MIDERGLPTRIEIDGGIGTPRTLVKILTRGADIIISGTGVFKATETEQWALGN